MRTVLFISAIVGIAISMVYFIFKGFLPCLIYQISHNINDKRRTESIQAIRRTFIVFSVSVLIIYVLDIFQ